MNIFITISYTFDRTLLGFELWEVNRKVFLSKNDYNHSKSAFLFSTAKFQTKPYLNILLIYVVLLLICDVKYFTVKCGTVEL